MPINSKYLLLISEQGKQSQIMNGEELFEILVRNGKQDGLDEYYTHKFSFETVFSIYSYSYCCCPCAFEHEFIDYLTDTGLNLTMFDRIRENIARGYCEHVDGVLAQYVHETLVTGQHIVAASGVLSADHAESETSIFRLHPYMIAVLKKHDPIVENYINYCYKMAKENDSYASTVTRLMYASRSIENPETIEIQAKQITEICASQKNPLLFSILDRGRLEDFDEQLSKAFEILYRDKSSDMLRRMYEFIRSSMFSYDVGHCLQSIIIYDEPEILADCLSHRPGSTDDKELKDLKDKVTLTSHFFHRERCSEVLRTANLFSDKVNFLYDDIEKDDLLDKATNSLNDYPERLSATFAVVLERDHTIHDIINGKLKEGFLQKKSAVKALADNGFDINGVGASGPIEGILSTVGEVLGYYNMREALEMFIYENVYIEGNKNSVVNAIVGDEMIMQEELYLDSLAAYIYGGILDTGYSGSYLMNGLEHSPYGHEGKSVALNFAAPLLLECGYPISNEMLHEALDKNLHDEELEYFRRYLSNPKSLQLSCCLALRTKFKGRAIHRFVEAANLPNTISDFVLFKHVLKCI